jgi:hypothetical protein
MSFSHLCEHNVPNSRCPRGNAAEAVASRLDKKIRENLRDARNSLFANDTLQVMNVPFLMRNRIERN